MLALLQLPVIILKLYRTVFQIGAIMGLGLAYAGTCKEEVQELLVPIVIDSEISMEVAGFASLSLGLVFAATQQEDCIQALLQVSFCEAFSRDISCCQWFTTQTPILSRR